MNSKAIGLIGIATKAGKISFGTEAVLDRVERKKTMLVVIAKDSSEKAKENIKFACNKNNIKFVEFSSIDEISHAIGKDNKSVICINEKNLGAEIYKIICGGGAIG